MVARLICVDSVFLFFCRAGKEHYPTLAYNVCVSHAKEIFHVTRSKPGTFNDKTLVRYDKMILVRRPHSPLVLCHSLCCALALRLSLFYPSSLLPQVSYYMKPPAAHHTK